MLQPQMPDTDDDDITQLFKVGDRDDRRKDPRRPCGARVQILEPIDKEGFALNESRTGLRIAVPGQLLVGTRCRVRVVRDAGVRWETTARIVWVTQTTDGCVAGLEYVPVRIAAG